MKAFSGVLPILTAMALVAGCGPESKPKNTETETDTSIDLSAAKAFATDIHQTTGGLQALVTEDGAMAQLSYDLDVAAEVHRQGLEQSSALLLGGAVAIVDVSLKAFTDWSGDIDDAPALYNIDYGRLPDRTDLATEGNGLFSGARDWLESDFGLTLISGNSYWDVSTHTMTIEVFTVDEQGVAFTLNSEVLLPESLTGTGFDISVETLSVKSEDGRINLSVEQSPAVQIQTEFYRAQDFNPEDDIALDMKYNAYKALKQIRVKTGDLLLDLATTESVDMTFGGSLDMTLLRTSQTDAYGGYLTVPTAFTARGRFRSGETEFNGEMVFTTEGLDGLYSYEDAFWGSFLNQREDGYFSDAENFLSHSYDAQTETLTVDAINELRTHGIYSDDIFDDQNRVVRVTRSISEAKGYSTLVESHFDADDRRLYSESANYTDSLSTAFELTASQDRYTNRRPMYMYLLDNRHFEVIDELTRQRVSPFTQRYLDITSLVMANSNEQGELYACEFLTDCQSRDGVSVAAYDYDYDASRITLEFEETSTQVVIAQSADEWTIQQTGRNVPSSILASTMAALDLSVDVSGRLMSSTVELEGKPYENWLTLDSLNIEVPDLSVSESTAGDMQLELATTGVDGDWTAADTLPTLDNVTIEGRFGLSLLPETNADLLSMSTGFKANSFDAAGDWLSSADNALNKITLDYGDRSFILESDYETGTLYVHDGHRPVVLEYSPSLDEVIGHIRQDGEIVADLIEGMDNIDALFVDGTRMTLTEY